MKHAWFPALFVALLALPLAAFAVDPASLPDIKKTRLGLYIEAKEVPDFLKNHPKALFLDLRTPEELLFVGTPQGIDGNAPFGIMNYNKWDDKKKTYVRFPNPDFLSNFEYWALDKGTEKGDPVVLICRSGDRSALGADFLAKQGYTNVWSVVDGFEGDLAKDGPNKGRRMVNGWKNIGLPWSYDLDRTRLLLRD
jgi:rhodanese-related sulfurtransferase